MNAARVHAVLVGGVSHPARLIEWAADPEALRSLGIDPDGLDLQALRAFAGLALKVRHNGVRDVLSQSFRLLYVTGLEIELFAAYAVALSSAGSSLGTSDLERIRALVAFVGGWHDPAVASQALLWDLLRHELSLIELTTSTCTQQSAAALALGPTLNAVMRIRGEVRLHEMQYDPERIMLALAQRVPDLESVPVQPAARCYWRAPGQHAVRVVELDAFGFAALQAAEGRFRVSELMAATGLGSGEHRAVCAMLAQLRDAGLISFEHPASRVE